MYLCLCCIVRAVLSGECVAGSGEWGAEERAGKKQSAQKRTLFGSHEKSFNTFVHCLYKTVQMT